MKKAYRDLPKHQKALISIEIHKLQTEGYNQAEIARIISKKYNIIFHRQQVNKIIKKSLEEKQRKTKQTLFENIYKALPLQLKESIRNEFLKVHQYGFDKYGERTRGRSKSKIYETFKSELMQYGILDKKKGTEFLSFFIEKEFGSWEKLELKRRPAKEKIRYTVPKRSLHRTPDLIEIDATQISSDEVKIEKEGKLIQSVVLIVHPYSGYIYPEPLIITNQTKKIRYYNFATNIYEEAKYLKGFYSLYGYTKQIRTDHAKSYQTPYFKSIVEKLGQTHILANKAYQKFMERENRDIKDFAIETITKAKTIEEARQAIKRAIMEYNNSEHKFKIFNSKHVPAQVFAAVKDQHFIVLPEDQLREAFAEEKTAVVRNNQINWEGFVYEFLMPQKLREGDYGRKPKQPRVIVKRDIENLSFLEVFDAETGEYLGQARLISSDVPTLDAAQARQLKNAEKRAKAKAKKLTEEINQINQEVEKVKEEIKEENLFSYDQLEKLEEEDPLKDLDILKLLSQGGEE